MLIEAKSFALAVVQSSSPDLSIQDKIKLYEEAYQAIELHNKPILEEQKEQRQKNTDAFLKAWTDGSSIF